MAVTSLNPTRLPARVGYIILSSATVEQRLVTLAATLIGPPAGATLATGQMADLLCDWCSRLATAQRTGPELAGVIKEHVKTAKTLLAQRNAMAHGIWETHSPTPSSQATPAAPPTIRTVEYRTRLVRRGGRTREEEWTDQKLDVLRQNLANLDSDLELDSINVRRHDHRQIIVPSRFQTNNIAIAQL